MQCPFLDHNQQVERFCINLNCCEKLRLSCNQCHEESFHIGHQKDQKLISNLSNFVEEISNKCEKEVIQILTELSDQINQMIFLLKDKIRSQFQISSYRLKTLNNIQINQMLCQFINLNNVSQEIIELKVVAQILLTTLDERIKNLDSNQLSYKQQSSWDIAEARQYYIEGLTLFKNGDYVKALSAFDTSLMIHPNQIDVMLWKGDSLYYSNSYQDALMQFKQVLKLDQSNINSLYGIGDCLYRLNQYSEAICWFDRILVLNSKHAKTLTKKGDCLQKMNNYQEAIFCYDKALCEDPSKFWTIQSKGSCLQELKKYQEAISCYDKALMLDQNNQIVKSQKSYCEQMLQK
ncbi:unnamed protein product [Paramecium sonneborni]|uniref:Tetratricopeptide repeat protein n=1 Tax=Paramecium sonneborni TaxID=65129 RepID=A0A8S1RNK6_9CILI|nr:unnamed protein product [Paramecium sonneborni]